MSVANILNKPTYVKGIGEIYPVRMIHYDEFMECANVISLTVDHFDVGEVRKIFGIPDDEEIKLLDLITFMSASSEDGSPLPLDNNPTFNQMKNLFEIVLQKEVTYQLTNEYGLTFNYGEGGMIYRDNYDELRKVIMSQNLLFEPKVYKDKLMQQWADKVLKARAKGGIDIDIEEYLTTIAVMSGKHYWDLSRYTIYQIKHEFSRIVKFKAFDTNLAMIGHSEKIGQDHYAEKTDVGKSPYEDLFVDKNKKLGKLNSSIEK